MRKYAIVVRMRQDGYVDPDPHGRRGERRGQPAVAVRGPRREHWYPSRARADESRARAFYIDRLAYKVSDSLRGTPGAFLRTSIAREHHSLFTAQSDHAGLNHVAFYMTDFHEVMLGGKHMTQSGWPTRWGPGRHRLGSNYFWYIKSPLGGAMEYTSDVDMVDDDWVPSEVDATFENAAIWSTQFVHSG